MDYLGATLFSLPALATALDLLLGDPHRLPHPVRAIGAFLTCLEPRARAWGLPLRLAGALCVLLTAGFCAGLVYLLLRVPLLGGAVALYLAYAGLALGQLVKEGRRALRLIESGAESGDLSAEMNAAREAVGFLVSRDTSALGPEELRRTLAETLSENLGDGFVCPLFYLVLAGPVGLWAYKAVSTMDSMWGYKTERYRELGWACARLDDALAYLPARLTAVLLILAGLCLGLDWRGALAHTARDARRMESPNAGWPMATSAWLLGAGMGGAAVYFGEVKMKPVLGPEGQPWRPEILSKLLRLLVIAGLFALFGFTSLRYFLFP